MEPWKIVLIVCAIVLTLAVVAYLFTTTPMCEAFGGTYYPQVDHCIDD